MFNIMLSHITYLNVNGDVNLGKCLPPYMYYVRLCVCARYLSTVFCYT